MRRATHQIRTPQGERHVTPQAWALLKNDKRYSLISVEGKEEVQEVKKKEVVEDAEDHKEISFAPVDEDIDEITALRDEYQELTGNEPDKRWKESTLKNKIDKLK